MKTKLFFLVLFIVVSQQSFSQKIPAIKVKDKQLGITSLAVDVQVVGNIATTTYDMLFYNPSNSVLEGELSFPLGEGQNVVRLALEINGNLREAVVVEKEQGRVAFEAVVRRGVDPVLLEKVTGNNYKARIYPIPARGYKRVVLAYDQKMTIQEAVHSIQLPLEFTQVLDHFEMNVEVLDTTQKAFIKSEMSNFKFEQNYLKQVAFVTKENFKPNEIIQISIPQKDESVTIIRDEDYFYSYQKITPKDKARVKPSTINLVWDASLSMQKRDLAKEIKLLNTYFNYLQNVKVNLIVFSNSIQDKIQFDIKDADWSVLKNRLKNSIYDGGTNYSVLKDVSDKNVDATLFFTDMMNNLSDDYPNFKKQLFIINSLTKTNHTQAKHVLKNNSGAYINLIRLKTNEAFRQLTYEKFILLAIETGNLETEIFPKAPLSIINDISFSGKNCHTGQVIKLKFGYGNTVTKVIDYQITNKVNSNPKLGKLWAQNKIIHLQNEGEKNKDTIIALSKEFHIISDFTSLIVLDDVRDYIRYSITPPADLKEAYDNLVQNNNIKRRVVNPNMTNTESEAAPRAGSFSITGMVADETGPLPGVSVLIRGTSTGTETDFDGKYRLAVKQGDILQFSYVGMDTSEASVHNSTMNILMQASSSNILDEVIVTGFGRKVEAKTVTYAVQKLSGDDISKTNETNIANALAGKIAGAQVTASSGSVGASSRVVLRGVTSLTGNNQPLYVVDGIPIDNSNIGDAGSLGGIDAPNGLSDINVNDIESISVLKGPAASALYGVRASNGVIVVKTKGSVARASSTQSLVNTNDKNKKIYKKQLKVSKFINKAIYLIPYKNIRNKVVFYNYYLSQKDNYKEHPAYFIDMYDLFKEKGFDDLAMRILSNIVEIDIDNYEQLKVFAYKMEAEYHLELAAFIYKKIVDLRSEDAQSYRDLALVLQKINREVEALKLLHFITSGDIYKNSKRRKFQGVTTIATHEITTILKNQKNEFDMTQYKTVKSGDTYDIRVVIDWNHNDTDIDLHVIDSNREECYYSHKITAMGGQLSQDLTQGFGPEEFTLKNAKTGDYFVKVKYFGDRYQKLENPTFLKVTIFKNYGGPNQTEETKVVRLNNKKETMILAKITI